jgi:glycosyltransferase involved in cell wall biosynthesis
MREILVVNQKGDKRGRYRFVYEPLRRLVDDEKLKIRVWVFSQERGLRGIVMAVKEGMRQLRKGRCALFCGADIAGLAWVLADRLGGTKAILRLGGDHVETLRILMRDAWLEKAVARWFVFLINRIATRIALGNATAIIVVSDGLAERLISRGMVRSCSPIFVVPQPIVLNYEEEKGKSKFEDTRGGLNLLTVTNFLYREKYEPITTIINSFLGDTWQKNAGNLPFINYSILGGGKYLKHLLDYVSLREGALLKRGIRIEIAGYVNDTSRWYRKADLFLYASTHDTLPNVILEAEAYGLPIVANELQAFKKLLVDGKNACFYKTGDAEGAAGAIIKLIRSPEMMTQMANNNLDTVRRDFSYQRVGELLRPVISFIESGEKRRVKKRV